jgi:hypothetical protein
MEIQSYITGFVDGEGCFSVSFSIRNNVKLGIEVRPSFSVSQNRRNKDIILKLKDYFSCGAVRYSKRDQNYKYEVRSLVDLTNIIIPHFEKYPLQTSKLNDFRAFKRVCRLLLKGQHLKSAGLKKVIEISDDINKSGKKKYIREDLLKLIVR